MAVLGILVLLSGCADAPAPAEAKEHGRDATWECTGSSSTEGRSVLVPATPPTQHTYEVPEDGMHHGRVDFVSFNVILRDPSGPVDVEVEGPQGTTARVTGSGTSEDPWVALVSDPAPGGYVLKLRSDLPVVSDGTWWAFAFQAGGVPDFRCSEILTPPYGW